MRAKRRRRLEFEMPQTVTGRVLVISFTLILMQGAIQDLKVTNSPHLASVQCEDVLPVSAAIYYDAIIYILFSRTHTNTHLYTLLSMMCQCCVSSLLSVCLSGIKMLLSVGSLFSFLYKTHINSSSGIP